MRKDHRGHVTRPHTVLGRASRATSPEKLDEYAYWAAGASVGYQTAVTLPPVCIVLYPTPDIAQFSELAAAAAYIRTKMPRIARYTRDIVEFESARVTCAQDEALATTSIARTFFLCERNLSRQSTGPDA
jgi:hypothetical protein